MESQKRDISSAPETRVRLNTLSTVTAICGLTAALGGMAGGCHSDDMAITATYRPAGLYTDPNPYSEVPDGALNQAQNVVHRSKGLLVHRPGMQPYVTSDATSDVREMFEYDGDVLIASLDVPQVNNTWILEWRSDASTVTSPPSFYRGEFYSAQARGNLYLNADDDIYKLTASQDTTTESAGIDGPVLIIFDSTTGSGTAQANNTDVRYQATVERTDANQVIIESPPSNSLIVENTTGGTVDVLIDVYLAPDAVAGDILRLFKSEEVTTGTDPSENLQLTVELELTASDISAGLVTVTDTTPPDDVTANLYTSWNEGGISLANNRPPVCKDIALFQRSLFFANTRLPHQIAFSWTAQVDRTGQATGIGSRAVTGTAAVGNPTLTAVADTTGIETGMYWISTGTGIPTGSLVVSTTVNTITFDTNAAASGADSGVTYDVIKIGSVTYAAGTPYILALAVNVGNDGLGTDLNDNSGTPDANVFARVIDGITSGAGGAPSSGEFKTTVQLVRKDTADTAFEIEATHGSEYTPIIPQIGSTALESTAETQPNAIYWSKDSQPEHVPTTNFVEIGDGSPIQRIVPTRDVLWVFKEDGIYRVSGNGAGPPASWRVDPYDLSHFLAGNRTPAVLDDIVYAFSNRGVIALSDGGVVNISDGSIADRMEPPQTAATGATPEANEDVFGFASEPTNEYWLQPFSNAQSDGRIYIWNTFTKAWTYMLGPRGEFGVVSIMSAGIHRNATSQVMLGVHPNKSEIWETKLFPVHQMADQEFSITITVDANGTDVEITANPDSYTPSVGDCISFPSGEGPALYSYIQTVTDPTNVVVSPAFSTTGSGKAATASYGYTSIIEYQWRTDNPGMSKNYYVSTWNFTSLGYMEDLEYEFTTPLDISATAQTRTFTLTGNMGTDPFGPANIRGYVDNDHARTSQIRPLLRMKGSCGVFTHSGLQMVFNPVGEKVAER